MANARAADISTELHLLARCRAGDEAAWRELYRAHFRFVFRLVHRLGIPEAERADVCQEVFLVAFRKLGSFVSGRFTTWLYRIAANVVSDKHRRRRLRETLQAIWGESSDQRVAPRPPDSEYEAREAEAQVGKILARMSQKKREVFALYELERLPPEEVAERVGCKVETMWTRLHYARKEFAKLAKKQNWVG